MRRELDERCARRRRGLPNLHAAALNTVRAGRTSLVGRERGIALNIFDHIDADPEFFAGNLAHGDAQPLAKIDFPGIERHRAVAVHGEERVDLLGINRARRSRGALSQRFQPRAGKCETHRERAAGEDSAAAQPMRGDLDRHVSLPAPTLSSRRA